MYVQENSSWRNTEIRLCWQFGGRPGYSGKTFWKISTLTDWEWVWRSLWPEITKIILFLAFLCTARAQMHCFRGELARHMAQPQFYFYFIGRCKSALHISSAQENLVQCTAVHHRLPYFHIFIFIRSYVVSLQSFACFTRVPTVSQIPQNVLKW